MKLEDLSQQDVIDLISYDPETGKCFWKIRDIRWFKEKKRTAEQSQRIWNNRFAGTEITYQCNGYIQPRIDYSPIHIQRLIWLRQTGEYPKGVIDHINGNRIDNRLINLRDISQNENTRNAKRRIDNKTGTTGVSLNKRQNAWEAYINNQEGEKVHLGFYSSIEEAINVRKTAEIEHGYSPTHGRET